MEWMLMPYRKLYRLIEGRSSRREYWMFVLFNILVLAAFVALIATTVGFATLSNIKDISGLMAGTGVVAIIILIIPFYIWALLTGVASFAVTIRRFHDLNLSGWIYVPVTILGIVPFVNFLVWIGMIVMMCMKGTAGPNRYGADPLAGDSAEDFA